MPSLTNQLYSNPLLAGCLFMQDGTFKWPLKNLWISGRLEKETSLKAVKAPAECLNFVNSIHTCAVT